MGLFYEINTRMILDAFKELSNRTDCGIFFTNISESPQDAWWIYFT